MKRKVQVFPSILAGDFGRLAEEAKRAEEAGADGLHLDIMDGHFVPNLTLGPKAVAAISRATSLFLDIHLMIYNPFDFVDRFVEAGADQMTFHAEATEHVKETLAHIRKRGVKAGLGFCPETSKEVMLSCLSSVDLLLIMSVNPGFGGQKFRPEVLDKIRLARRLAPNLDIQVDGGINQETAKACVLAGANVLVAGSYLYQADNMKEAIGDLR